MFQLKLPRSYASHLLCHSGNEPGPLSPATSLWLGLASTEPDAAPGAELPFSEATLTAAANALLRPGKVTAIRIGGNRNTPEQRRFASNESDGLQVGMVELPSGDILLEGFENEEKLIDWLVEIATPLGESHRAGAQLLPQELSTSETLHALHLIDFYRRTHYESMIDYTLENELAFSGLAFTETLYESLASGDYRWLLPTTNIVVPTGIPSSFDDCFRWLGEHGLIKRTNDPKHSGLWTFDRVGEMLGLEFFLGWLVSTGVETGHSTNEGPRRGEEALVIHTTIKGLHALRFSPDGSVAYEPVGADEVRSHFQSLISQPAGKAVPPTETTPEKEPLPSVPDTTEPEEQPFEKAPRFCTQCSKPLISGAKFCGSCGTKIAES